jgi:hypothetical protein
MADLNLDTVADTARDAFYITVGAGVIAFQKLQVQRVELTKAVAAQLDDAKGTANDSLATAKAQLDSASELVDERVKLLEERLTSLEGRLESSSTSSRAAPEQAKDLVKQARDLVARCLSSHRAGRAGADKIPCHQDPPSGSGALSSSTMTDQDQVLTFLHQAKARVEGDGIDPTLGSEAVRYTRDRLEEALPYVHAGSELPADARLKPVKQVVLGLSRPVTSSQAPFNRAILQALDGAAAAIEGLAHSVDLGDQHANRVQAALATTESAVDDLVDDGRAMRSQLPTYGFGDRAGHEVVAARSDSDHRRPAGHDLPHRPQISRPRPDTGN